MNIFPTCLPTDIVYTIFNFIDQKDCVECMCACRAWKKEMPSYATKVWEQVVISPTSWSRFNNAMLDCLGSHVKKVMIDRLDACYILNMLNDKGCTEIRRLEIANPIYRIMNDKDNCSSFDTKDVKFLESIGQFRHTLKELYIMDYPSYILAADLMHYFPNLTHLSLLYSHKIHHLWEQECQHNGTISIFQQEKDNELQSKNSNMVYLRLKIPKCQDINTTLIPTLKRCPQLKCLLVTASDNARRRLSIHDNNDNDDSNSDIKLDSIIQLCPNLEYIMWNVHRLYFRKNQRSNIISEWEQRSSQKKQTAIHENYGSSSKEENCIERGNKVQGLIFEGYIDDINTIMSSSLLTKSQHSLSHLELFNVEMDRSRDWRVVFPVTPSTLYSNAITSHHHSSTIQQYPFSPHLETLKLTNLEMPYENGWTVLFSQCHNLKSLDISLGPFDMRWDHIVQGITLSLKQLRHLRLHDNDYRATPHLDFWDCIRMLSHCSHLRCLEIHNICISDQDLIGLCDIRSLRELSLQIGFLHEISLMGFANKLVTASSHNKDVLLSLETLKLISAHNLNDTVLERLAHVKSLSFLSVQWNSRISDAGVKAFVRQQDQTASSTHAVSKVKHKRFFVDQCSSVSRWGIWTHEDC